MSQDKDLYRVGASKDIHRLVPNRKLILAGVIVPFDLGEEAHSDGDVVYHAVAEAMLGSLALGDLGKHFPDNDDQYKDMDSSLIMKKVNDMVSSKGYHVVNVDVFISLEKPKLAPFISMMQTNIATLLNVDIEYVSVKAGTNEKIGPVGQGQAVEAYCTLLVRKK